MNHRIALAFAALIVSVGCGGSGDSQGQGDPAPEPAEKVTGQSEFDFTNLADREWFTAIDLSYRASIGPYAAYDVTGPRPMLAGPTVELAGANGYGMLCGAKDYFSSDEDAALTHMQLLAGAAHTRIVDAAMSTTKEGQCSGASDSFGEKYPIPDLGDTTSDEAEANGYVARSTSIGVGFEPAPPIGAIVLIRRIGLFLEQPGHNDSHVIPSVCCSGESCGLEPQPK